MASTTSECVERGTSEYVERRGEWRGERMNVLHEEERGELNEMVLKEGESSEFKDFFLYLTKVSVASLTNFCTKRSSEWLE